MTDELLHNLSEGRLDKAFNILSKMYAEDSEKFEHGIIFVQRYKKLKRDKNRGIITYNESTAQENRLIYDTIDYLREVGEEERQNDETSIDLILKILHQTKFEDAYDQLGLLREKYPKSKTLAIGFASLEIRKGLNTFSRSLVDQRFMELFNILNEEDPIFYKTVFCLLTIYKYDYYDAWELSLPIKGSLTYNYYLTDSVLIKEFLLKMRLSSQSKAEIHRIYKMQ